VQTTGANLNPWGLGGYDTSGQELNAGGFEQVKSDGGQVVHQVYGAADKNGHRELLTTYTEMPASGLTMNSTLAAQTNGTIGPAFPKQLPGGNIEVIYPSEFVPGADVHVIRGPADANGYRPVITSFLQPQKALADENAASLQPQTVSAPNGGVPSGPVQPGTPSVNQPISSPSNSGTTTATANPPSGGVMLHGGTNTAPTAPANGIFNPSRVSTVSRITNFWILPVTVIGNSSTNST